jgi:hypothetical protein
VPESFVFIGLGIVLQTFIGGAIGEAARGQFLSGCLLGMLLGPLGWVLVLAVNDKRRKCPSCRGAVPGDAMKCRHCGDPL